jgi:hypothetical protein
MNKDTSKSTNKGFNKNRILDQIIAAVIGLVVGSVITGGFHVIKELNKGKLRINYPLLIYKCEYIEEHESKKVGFLGLVDTDPQWIYFLSFANLSNETVKNIDISLKIGLKSSGVYCNPVGCQLSAEPKKFLPDKTYTLLGSNIDRIHLLGKELPSGRSAACCLIICSKERPSISDFEITIYCPNGKFEKINSVEWEHIGWQNAKE